MVVRLLIGLVVASGCRIGFDPRVEPADAPGDITIDVPATATMTVTFGERPTSQVQGVTADTHIVQGAPNSNYGGDDNLSLYGMTAPERPLVRFDLSSIAAGRRVVGARLQLVMVDFGDQEAGSIAAFRLDETWTEGTGVAMISGGATWRDRDSGVPWSTPGGTRSPDAYGTQSPGLTPTELSFDVPATVVQAWIDAPATNAGLILDVLTDNTHYHFFSSEESIDTDKRPQLVLELEEP